MEHVASTFTSTVASLPLPAKYAGPPLYPSLPIEAMTPAEEPLGRLPLSWTGVHPSEPPLPPVKFAGTGLMPGRPHAAALASVDATQVGTGKPSDPIRSLPLLSRCRPQNTLRLAGHSHGPGTETHDSSGRTQTKGRPVHAIRPEWRELYGVRGLST